MSEDKGDRFKDRIKTARRSVRRSVSGEGKTVEEMLAKTKNPHSRNRRSSETMTGAMKHMDPAKIIAQLEQMAAADDENCLEALQDLKFSDGTRSSGTRRKSTTKPQEVPSA